MGAGRQSRRLKREARTLEVMVAMYCRDHHHPAAGARLCDDCTALLTYAQRRLSGCRYGAYKPTCARCPTHCYVPEKRELVRAVMRYSGPRMLKRHPLLALAHLADGRRRPPPRPA